jgi:Fic family protein
MALKETLKQIDELQTKINSFGKLSDDVLKKINYKFRLDWNYHSNAMEGNSLTKEETRSVMINNITIEGKPLKDVLEVKGHDEIVTTILKVGKGELRLSEKRIKEIHKAIMHEDNPEQALKIGEWKKTENHILNYKGEKYDFVASADVPDEIHKLLNWLNTKYDEINSKSKNAIHPALLAFEFHLKYVTIHPFYDGNGRTSRILMNLILVMLGYPPVIVKVSDKDAYNQYLADIQAYGGNSDLFFEFMGKLLMKSQELVLTAVEGGDIDEPDDLDKKILLLEKELSGVDPDNEIKEKFSADSFLKLYEGWLSEMLRSVIITVQKFNRFFTGIDHKIFIGSPTSSTSIKFVDEDPKIIIEKLKLESEARKDLFAFGDGELFFKTFYGSFTKGGLNTFGCSYNIKIKFEYFKYSVLIDEYGKPGKKEQRFFIQERLLHQPMTTEEINNLSKSFGDTIYKHINFCTKQKGIR